MNIRSLRDAVPRLTVVAAVLAFLYDAPHLLFDDDYAKASDHPLYIFHAAMGIAAMTVLALVVGGLLLRADDRLRGSLPAVAGTVTLAGIVLVAGGTWGEGFMIPYLADIEPSVFAGEVGGFLLAIIALGGLAFSVGWLLIAVTLRRADLLSRNQGLAMGGGALLALLPLPLTVFVFATTLAVVAQRRHATAPDGTSQLVTA